MYISGSFMRSKWEDEGKLRFYFRCVQLNDFSSTHTTKKVITSTRLLYMLHTRERKDNEAKEVEKTRETGQAAFTVH